MSDSYKEKGKYRTFRVAGQHLHDIVNLYRLFLFTPLELFEIRAIIGKLVPVKVSIPALVEEDDEEPEYSATQKGKRKAAPTDDSEL